MAGDRPDSTTTRLTLAEISRGCGVSAESILMLVSEGVLTPVGREQFEWHFDIEDLARARCALRIQRDLGVNCAGAALAVDLIEETQRLRERVRVLEALAFRR